MNNTELNDFQHPEDEKLWNRIKPMNAWNPNTDLAWSKFSLQLGTAVTTTVFATATPAKAIAKLTLKKILIWSGIGSSIVAATVYQIKYNERQNKPSKANNQPMVKSTIADSVATNPNSIKPSIETNSESSLPHNLPIHAPSISESNTANNNIEHQTKVTSTNAPASKILQFKQTELSVVAEILSQTYGVNVKIEKPQLLQCKLTATFDNEPLNTILNIIQETFNMEIVPEKDTIWLKGGSCQ